jgi:RNA polymerase sigma-70 factor (TIGR02943 family)
MECFMGTEITTTTGALQTNKSNLQPHLWVDLHADYLYAYALKRLNDVDLARDLVQDTFLAALEKTSTFKGDSTERTWLTAIIKYKVIDIYRKKTRQISRNAISNTAQEAEFFDPDLTNWKKEHWPVPFGIEEQDPLHNKEFNLILQKCMAKLPPLWLSAFTMKHMDDNVTVTICKELKITAANFWVIMHRAKVNLRSCLQKNWI